MNVKNERIGRVFELRNETQEEGIGVGEVARAMKRMKHLVQMIYQWRPRECLINKGLRYSWMCLQSYWRSSKCQKNNLNLQEQRRYSGVSISAQQFSFMPKRSIKLTVSLLYNNSWKSTEKGRETYTVYMS